MSQGWKLYQGSGDVKIWYCHCYSSPNCMFIWNMRLFESIWLHGKVSRSGQWNIVRLIYLVLKGILVTVHTTCVSIWKLPFLHTHGIYMFCMVLTINSDSFAIHQEPVGLCNCDGSFSSWVLLVFSRNLSTLCLTSEVIQFWKLYKDNVNLNT